MTLEPIGARVCDGYGKHGTIVGIAEVDYPYVLDIVHRGESFRYPEPSPTGRREPCYVIVADVPAGPGWDFVQTAWPELFERCRCAEHRLTDVADAITESFGE